jgi:hypothetical protein
VVLGQRQALALEGQRRGIARPTPQEAAGGALEFSDALTCFVRAALRLGMRAACGAKLVGEVFGSRGSRWRMTSRSSCEPRRRVSDPSQPPAWTLESWPESPIAMTCASQTRTGPG